MTKGVSRISYSAAINQGLRQAMELSDRVFVYGIGADGKSGIFGTTTGLVETFERSASSTHRSPNRR